MAEVGLDLVDAPQLSGIRFRQHLGNRGLPPPLVSHSENQPGVAAQANRLFGARLVQGQRLLAEHVLSSPDCSLDLFAVQRVRRRQNDGFDLRIAKRVPVVGRQGDALLVTERARRLKVRLDVANHADVSRCSAQNAEHFLAPPAHADESYSDRPTHSGLISRLRRKGARWPWRRPKSVAPAAAPSSDRRAGKQSFISAKGEAGSKARLTCILSDAPPLWRRHRV